MLLSCSTLPLDPAKANGLVGIVFIISVCFVQKDLESL